ncbi:unnamed protein product [Pleuronectes platessa]|uniref:Uncharacterized protein n=1 Tax=Pleuronectes platessa TaxID=8262 RepID=A0A9N7YL22_PLEPL|nr:unnamed protein product [Pleuronectes platessa]
MGEKRRRTAFPSASTSGASPGLEDDDEPPLSLVSLARCLAGNLWGAGHKAKRGDMRGEETFFVGRPVTSVAPGKPLNQEDFSQEPTFLTFLRSDVRGDGIWSRCCLQGPRRGWDP